MIECKPERKINIEPETYAQKVFDERFSSPSKLAIRQFTRENLGQTKGNPYFCTHFVGSNQYNLCPHREELGQTILRGESASSNISQYDFAQLFSFTIAHAPGSVNAATDFLSRVDAKILKMMDKMLLKN